jgi:hypothetical protein
MACHAAFGLARKLRAFRRIVKIFISYSSADRSWATEIQLALVGSAHQVFFDKEDLPAGGDFHARIRAEVNDCELFVFLISPHSVSAGSYTLTELKQARRRWPHPKEHVLPVMIVPTPLAQVPEYLRAVTILEPEGSVAAEVAAEVEARQEPAAGSRPAGAAIAGSWRDLNNPNSGSRITQDGTSFRFNGWGVLPNGVSFESSGSGTVNGNDIVSTYQARYQNGWTSSGQCRGTVSPDGSRMTLTCTDTILGTFVSSGARDS